MRRITTKLPSPALLLSILALVAACIGTAVALPGHNSVRSDDIKNGQVKRDDRAPGERTLWALIDGSSDSVIRSSGGVTVAAGGNTFDYVNFHENLKGRGILVTPQWDNEPSFSNAIICGPGTTEETTSCSFVGTDSRVVFVDMDIDDDFYVVALPK
jgi:hypothetical protein